MNKRVLIIDDEQDTLEVFEMALRMLGHKIILSSKSDVIEQVEELDPSLILLDHHMGEKQRPGGELCRDLKVNTHTRHIPVIMLSYDLSIARIAQECGADGYLQKPFGIKDLRKKVNDYLSADHT